jgi:hypothetical protein
LSARSSFPLTFSPQKLAYAPPSPLTFSTKAYIISKLPSPLARSSISVRTLTNELKKITSVNTLTITLATVNTLTITLASGLTKKLATVNTLTITLASGLTKKLVKKLASGLTKKLVKNYMHRG